MRIDELWTSVDTDAASSSDAGAFWIVVGTGLFVATVVWALRLRNRVSQLGETHGRTAQELHQRADRESALKAELDATRKELEETKRQLSGLRESVTWVEERTYHVLIDGEKGAGKSALITKWVNPMLDITHLASSRAISGYRDELCSEHYVDAEGRRCERRHVLVYHDAPGEQPELMRQLVDESPPSVLIFVVDPARLRDGMSRFGQDRLVFLYGAKAVRDNLRCCLVWVSKFDKYDPGSQHAWRSTVESTLVPVFRQAKLEPTVFYGSALTNLELADARAFIVRHLGLEGFFQTVKDIVPGG